MPSRQSSASCVATVPFTSPAANTAFIGDPANDVEGDFSKNYEDFVRWEQSSDQIHEQLYAPFRILERIWFCAVEFLCKGSQGAWAGFAGWSAKMQLQQLRNDQAAWIEWACNLLPGQWTMPQLAERYEEVEELVRSVHEDLPKRLKALPPSVEMAASALRPNLPVEYQKELRWLYQQQEAGGRRLKIAIETIYRNFDQASGSTSARSNLQEQYVGPKYVNIKEIANAAGVRAEETIRRWMKVDLLPHHEFDRDGKTHLWLWNGEDGARIWLEKQRPILSPLPLEFPEDWRDRREPG